MPSTGEPASRATRSATSRSRPKKTSASSTSKLARPLNGQHRGIPGRLDALAGRLQLDDAGGEVVLGRAQPGALAGRAVRGGAEPAGGLVARPPARRGVDAAGHAAALLDEALDRRRVAVLARDRLDVGGAERPERQRRAGAVGRGREHEQRALPRCGRAGGARAVDHEQRRAAGGAGLLDDLRASGAGQA